jgi:hypothetical protein
MLRGLPVLFALALLASGCSGGGGGGRSVSVSKGDSLVLSADDVGRAFTQFDRGPQRRPDFTPPRDDLTRFGRKGGWKARFKRLGTPKTEGPLVISSLADLFGSAKGANDDFDLYKQWLIEFTTTGGKELAAPGLGDESQAVTYSQGLGRSTVTYYVMAWRDGSVTASLTVSGFKLTWPQALALAQKQENRIRVAGSSA